MSVRQMRRNVPFATRARFSLHQIDSGDTLRGEPIDRDGETAIKAMLQVSKMADRESISISNQARCGLSTTGSSATVVPRLSIASQPDPKRRLIRVWPRQRGHCAYSG
jgi:hypothetical protein